MAAAVADYTPAERAAQKVPKDGDTLTLRAEEDAGHPRRPRRAAAGVGQRAAARRLRRRDRGRRRARDREARAQARRPDRRQRRVARRRRLRRRHQRGHDRRRRRRRDAAAPVEVARRGRRSSIGSKSCSADREQLAEQSLQCRGCQPDRRRWTAIQLARTSAIRRRARRRRREPRPGVAPRAQPQVRLSTPARGDAEAARSGERRSR